jgi:acyl CoA:acetate/3-ketoacid CoA transferase alpha subunit
VPLHEGPDKTATLADAISRHVHAGDTVYLGSAHGRPNPQVREVARQWWGKTPAFTLAVVGLGSPWTALVHGGLVRRVITTFMGEGYPFPTPQALISKAVLDGRLEVSNWSMLTFPLRLLAGAMGVPFLPRHSLVGSSMEEDNTPSGEFMTVDDPFGAEGRVGYARALVPDVASSARLRKPTWCGRPGRPASGPSRWRRRCAASRRRRRTSWPWSACSTRAATSSARDLPLPSGERAG